MSKFHANPTTGDVNPCGAVAGKCPFGESLHGESQVAAEAAYAEFVNANSDENTAFGSLKKNRAIVNDPANAKVVAAARAVYAELQSLDAYKDRDRQLWLKLKRTKSSDPEFQKLQEEKLALEDVIADLDPSSEYSKNPESKTVKITGVDDERDFRTLDEEYKNTELAMNIDLGGTWDMKGVEKLRNERDAAAERVGQPTTKQLQIMKAQERLNNSLTLFKDADPYRASFIARQNRDAADLVGDEDARDYWQYQTINASAIVAEDALEKVKHERFNLRKSRRIRDAKEYAEDARAHAEALKREFGGKPFLDKQESRFA